MKFFLSFLFSVLAVAFTFGQSTKNRQDLDFLYLKIVKLPSYKDQFSKKEKNNFKQKLDNLKIGIESDSDFELFLKLYSLVTSIKDNHLSLYANPESKNKINFNTEIFGLNLDSLKQIVKNKSDKSVEGIYKTGNYELLIYKDFEFFKLLNIKGAKPSVVGFLKETQPNHFDFISSKNGLIYSSRNLVYINSRLSGTPFKKYELKDFVNIYPNEDEFQFKKINKNISYLRLGSFATFNENIVVSNKFYNRIKDSLITKNIIVDLRENGGGGFKTSKVYLNLLKSYKGKIHLIVNNFTISNAEQFVNELQNRTNVMIYGETTKGTIAYGNNRGTNFTLPSGRFVFYPTDMNARKRDLKFENVGVSPDVLLDPFLKDWVEQVMDKIDGK